MPWTQKNWATMVAAWRGGLGLWDIGRFGFGDLFDSMEERVICFGLNLESSLFG